MIEKRRDEALGIEVESGGEGDFDGWIFGEKGGAEGAGGVFLRVEEGALLLGVDNPDPFDADGEIFLNFGEHTDHAVFWREDFDDEEGRDGGDAGAYVVGQPRCEVGYPVTVSRDLNSDFCEHQQAEAAPELP